MQTSSRIRGNACGIWAAVAITLLAGCGGASLPEGPSESAPIDRALCVAPDGMVLTDIESVTDWINALPKPLDLPCFMQSLPRPFPVNLTQSTFSAQRANGRGNPRIFIFIDRLILSVVPQALIPKSVTGPTPNLLELSFRTEGFNSIKAELAFPLQHNIPYSEPYVRTNSGEVRSNCGTCHASEKTVLEFDNASAFESRMLRPFDGYEVSIQELKTAAVFCNPVTEPHRCAMLDAVVGEGDLYWQEFPVETP